jgi:hypothetical protein
MTKRRGKPSTKRAPSRRLPRPLLAKMLGESEIEALHKCLVDSRKLAEALTIMIMAAESRVAVAIANTAQP